MTSKLNVVALEKASTEWSGMMNRKAYWGVLALAFMALAFLSGCSSSPQSPPPAQVITVAAVASYEQTAEVGTMYATTFQAQVLLNGTPVGAGQTVTFNAPTSGAGGTFGSAGGNVYATETTNSMGVATAPNFYANGTVGTYNVVASTGGTNSTATFALSNTLVPAPVTASGGTPQSAVFSTNYANAMSATVLNASGAPVAGIEVTFTAPATGASGYFGYSNMNTLTIMTNSSGVANAGTFTANSTVGGPYTVTATTQDGDASTATFTLSNTVAPMTITATAGTPQTTAVSTPFPVQLSATVLDVNGDPIPNAVVTFSAPSFTVPMSGPASTASGLFSDSGGTSTTAWTNASGVATAAVFTANSAMGTFTVTATVPGLPGSASPASFSLTNN
ncbi:MAG: hypothetical protein ABSA78_06940 [Candidatus Sulfotelmatobacter sp.]